MILNALADLPDDLDPQLIEKAETHLLELAADHDAKALKILGRRILEVADPEAADAHEAALLEREERDAAAATRLTVWEDTHGRLQGRFTLDGLTGAMFKKALYAFAAPKHRAATTGPLGERRPTPERLGQAFAEMIQRYPVKKLPKTGGLNATVVVTMTLDTLLGGLKAAQLDTGAVISASQARRLACEAKIIPAVLGGKSQVLDLGRANRFHNRSPTHRQSHRGRRLRSGRLRRPTGHEPHPPPRSLGQTAVARPRRHHALPRPPRQSPRPTAHPDQASHRQVRLPPTHVGRPHPCRQHHRDRKECPWSHIACDRHAVEARGGPCRNAASAHRRVRLPPTHVGRRHTWPQAVGNRVRLARVVALGLLRDAVHPMTIRGLTAAAGRDGRPRSPPAAPRRR